MGEYMGISKQPNCIKQSTEFFSNSIRTRPLPNDKSEITHKMATRMLRPAMRLSSPSAALTTRSFQTSTRRFAEVAAPLPVRKPVGAFRGGLFGFLLGSTLAGAGVYYYVLDEYKVSNGLLSEDIYSLQASVQRVHSYVQTLRRSSLSWRRKSKGKAFN